MEGRARAWACVWLWVWVLGGRGGVVAALYCESFRNAVAVWPAGDQLLRWGQPLRLYCLLEPGAGADAARVYFTNGSQLLPPQLVRRLNDTAVLLDIPRPDKQDSTYFCRYENHWCNKKVVVDSEPGPVEDFKCRSYNLENLTCSWTYSHYAKTNFSLYVMLNGIMLRDRCLITYLNWDYACTFKELNGETNIDFLLNISNDLGTYNETFHINQHEVVIPAKPYNLIFENITEDGVDLSWSLDNNLIMLDKAVVHKIQYQIYQLDNISSWHEAQAEPGGGVRLSRDTHYSFRLRRLPYANWRYEVRVYVRSALAPDAPEFWSQYAYNTTIRTRPRAPARSPALAPGGFDHLYSANASQRRDIYLYWTQIEKYEENGDNFTYRITVRQDSQKWILYSSQSPSYVQIERASLGSMEVCVESVNAVGVSEPCSRLWVPAQADVLGPAVSPDQLTTVVYDNDTYELSWQKPTVPAGFDNYTLFWCYNDSPNLCKTGGFNFTSLPSDRTNHTIQLVPAETSKKYQFAIAVNAGGSTTGMTWANCKLANGRIAVKTRIERDEVGARYVAFHWTLDCKYRDGDILGYNVTYCPLRRNFTCDAARLQSLFVAHEAARARQQLRLAALVPYTMYRFTVTVKSIHGFAAGDNSMNVTTLPDRPSPPRGLALPELGARRALLRWAAPRDRYGKIVKYVVTWRWAEGEDDAQLLHPAPEHAAANATLQPLHSFTNYSVTVVACNGLDPKFCSEPSAALHFRTAAGAPSPVARPRLLALPAAPARRRLQWSPPLYPGGALDYYQVRYNRSDRDDSEIYNVTDNFLDVEWCKYKGVQSEWFQVRGVNLDAESDHGARVWAGGELEEGARGVGEEGEEGGEGAVRRLPGPWSDAVTSKCPNTMDAYLLWTLSCILCMGVVALMLYGSWRAWNRFKEMADLKPVLPPSMEDIIDKEKNVKSSLGRSALAKSKEDRHRASSADEALLLPAGAGCGASAKELAPALPRASSPAPSVAPSTAPPSTAPPSPVAPAQALAPGAVSPVLSSLAGRPGSLPAAPAAPALPLTAPVSAPASAPPPLVAPGYIRPWTSNVLQPPNFSDSFNFDDKIEELESLDEEIEGPSVTASKERGPSSGYVVCAPAPVAAPAPAPARGKGAPPIPSGYLRATDRAAPAAPAGPDVVARAGAAPAGKLLAPLGPLPAPQEYCRFGWSEDPATDNLQALLAPPAAASATLSPSPTCTAAPTPVPVPVPVPATAPHHAS